MSCTAFWNDNALFFLKAPCLSIWANTVSTWIIVGASWFFDAALSVAPEPSSLDCHAFSTGVVELTALWNLNTGVCDVAAEEA